MFKLGIIEESLEHKDVLDIVKPYYFSQRIENIPEDIESIWHTNEYHVPNEEIEELLILLINEVKATWYIHAFSNEKLYVVLKDKYFEVSLERDETWNEMIDYGATYAEVERCFLENIPLHV